MRRGIVFLLLALLPLVMAGCSSSNSSDGSAVPDNRAHPLDWIGTHPAAALATANFADCIGCHGTDLKGIGDAVSCYSCHSYNTTPPFIVHPASWTDPYIDHRGYASANGFDSCAKCHGSDLRGSAAAPSCFASSFDSRPCHPNGPGVAPHPLDSTYLNGAVHGPDAKADLTACQACHGQPGGPGSNPRFNVGINSVNGTGCEACHGVNLAHPADWAGPNPTFHYTAGNIRNACTLCHGVDLDGVGGVGVSCLICHAEAVNFTLDCIVCHGYPPANHGNVSTIGSHDVCVVCHGMKESATGGSFAAVANYALFDKTTDTIGAHWDGNINMNSTPGYNQANFGCDTAVCHANDAGHQLSDSGLPVVLGAYGLGAAVPHALDGSFLLPANHGPAAKGLTASFPDGLLDCQPCHAQAGNDNPRFNVGIVNPAVPNPGNGCEGCHNDLTAHPSVGARDNAPWYDVNVTHNDVNGFATMCVLCHDTPAGGPPSGGVGPACSVCHPADPLANPTGCVSCHNVPPDGGAPAGNATPNRTGQHGRAGHSSLISAIPADTCARCHNNAGAGTAAHFDLIRPADVDFIHPDASDTITVVSSTATDTTCNGACHLNAGTFNHGNETWYGGD